MPYLRLEAAAGLVKSGDVLCDVGSDHAYLPLMLIKNGVIERAVACDVNAGPLERGRQHAAKQGVSSIEFVLSDGLGSVETPFDVAAICGMGGELIIRIIREGGEKGKKRLILQPMTGIEKVRAFLWQSGFAITDEVFPVEDGKAYCVIGAEFSGAVPDFSYADTYLGKIRPGGDGFTAWAKKICAAAKKRLRGARDAESENNILTLISECEKHGA